MKKIYLILAGLLGLHLFLLANLQFTAWPETVSFPYLFNNGFKLYGDMVHAYPPALTLVLAGVYKVFGYKLLTLKIFTWLGILASDVLIFLIVRQLTGRSLHATIGLLFYILLQPFLDGNMLWFDTVLTLPILLAIYFRRNLFLSGIFLAAALLTKQTALVFVVAFFLRARNFRFLIPIAISLGIFLLWLAASGQLIDFYNWNFYYPATYWTKYPSYQILSLTRGEIFALFLTLLPSAVLLATRFKKFLENKDLILLFLFLAAGIVAGLPRFSFYHFQPALAIAAVLFGVSLKSFRTFPGPLLITYYLLLILTISIPAAKLSWQKETRFWSESDRQLAETVSAAVPKGKGVYLLGPHSGLYVLADRLPPKPWIDNFGWYFEIPQVQEGTIKSWEQNPPAVIVIQDSVPGEWYLIGTYQPKKIIEWIRENYNRKEELKPGIWLWEKK